MDEQLPFDATQTIFPVTFSQATIARLGLEDVGKEALNILESPSEEDLKDLPHPDLQVNDITSVGWYELWANPPLAQLFYKAIESSQWILQEELGQMAIAKTDYIKLDKDSQYNLDCSPNTELVGLFIVKDNPQKDAEGDSGCPTINLEIEDPALDKKRLTSQTENHKIFSGEELVFSVNVEGQTVLLMPSFLRCRFSNNSDSNFKIYKSDLCFKSRHLNPYVESHLHEVDYQERLEKEVGSLLDLHFSSLITRSDVLTLSESEQKAKAREVAQMSIEDKYNYYKAEHEANLAEQQPIAALDPADQIDLDAMDEQEEE